MSTIIINGKTFTWKNISINNGSVTIDWKTEDYPEEKVINVEVTGDVDCIDIVNGSISVKWNCGWSIKATNWNIDVWWAVAWSIKTVNWNVRSG